MKVCEPVAAFLKEYGIDIAFGLIGDANMYVSGNCSGPGGLWTSADCWGDPGLAVEQVE